MPKLYPELTKEYQFVTNVRENVESLEGVKKYYERQDAIKVPHVPEWIGVIKF